MADDYKTIPTTPTTYVLHGLLQDAYYTKGGKLRAGSKLFTNKLVDEEGYFIDPYTNKRIAGPLVNAKGTYGIIPHPKVTINFAQVKKSLIHSFSSGSSFPPSTTDVGGPPYTPMASFEDTSKSRSTASTSRSTDSASTSRSTASTSRSAASTSRSADSASTEDVNTAYAVDTTYSMTPVVGQSTTTTTTTTVLPMKPIRGDKIYSIEALIKPGSSESHPFTVREGLRKFLTSDISVRRHDYDLEYERFVSYHRWELAVRVAGSFEVFAMAVCDGLKDVYQASWSVRDWIHRLRPLFDEDGTICFRPRYWQEGDAHELEAEYSCLNIILLLLLHTRSSIQMSTFQLTHPKILATLGALCYYKKVVVNIVLDMRQLSAQKEALHMLLKMGASIHVDCNSYFHHDKIIVFDNECVLVGSFNFTANAAEKNTENFAVRCDTQHVGVYAKRMDAFFYNSVPYRFRENEIATKCRK